MNRKIRSLALILITGLFVFQLPAQRSTQKLSNVNVNEMTDEQLQKYVQQATMRGMTYEDAMKLAKAQGATQEQIDQITKRIKNLKNFKGSGLNEEKADLMMGVEDGTEVLSEDDIMYYYSKKKEFELTEKQKKIFGSQFFNSKNLSFEPSLNVPVPKDYVLGVNDELSVNVWGNGQQNYEAKIDRSGSIYLEGVGQINVLGLTIDDAKRKIKQRLAAIYSGMNGMNPSTWADVSLSNMRAIKVNVLGEVMEPGTYSLPATSNAFNALYLSGGPNENGSFRTIRIIRDNKVIMHLDVYDYLINSETKCNIALRDQDIIFVPAYECRVDFEGAVKRSGFYEMKKGETVDKLIKFAGGFTGDAYKSSLSVFRYTDFQRRVEDVTSKQFNSFMPMNGDSITTGVVVDRFENKVDISGAVFRPGSYALASDMKISGLIQKAQGLTEDVFNNRGLIFRKNKDLSPYVLPFDVSEIINGKNDVLLQRDDSVVIQDIFSMREKRYVMILGEVQKSAEYKYYDGMTISDLIFQAGGLKESASESFIEVSRRHSYEDAAKTVNDLVSLFQFKIYRDLRLSNEDKNFFLKPYDYVYIRRAPSYYEQKTVTIEGEVLYPGQYSVSSKTERVSDLIRRSGGLTSHAYVHGATLFRNAEKEMKDTTILENLGIDTLMNKATKQLTNGRVELQLDKILKDTASIYNYLLKEGDKIVIPEVSEEVRVVGEVLNPVGLAFEPGKNAKYYIDRAGGFSDKANERKVYVVNSDGTTKVTKTFIFTSYPRVQPGSKVIVPEKPEKETMDAAMWLAIASTFSSIAVAIAAILPSLSQN